MDKLYGKSTVDIPEIDAVLGNKYPGIDTVLNRTPAPYTPKPVETVKSPLVSDILSKSLQTIASKIGVSQLQVNATAGKSTQPQTVIMSPEQVSTMESGIRNIKAETTNQINVNLPYGAIQVNVKSDDIDYDAIGQQVGSRLADAMRRKTQNLKE